MQCCVPGPEIMIWAEGWHLTDIATQGHPSPMFWKVLKKVSVYYIQNAVYYYVSNLFYFDIYVFVYFFRRIKLKIFLVLSWVCLFHFLKMSIFYLPKLHCIFYLTFRLRILLISIMILECLKNLFIYWICLFFIVVEIFPSSNTA